MTAEPMTVALPGDLMAAVDRLVEEGKARSREELVESALRRELAEARRAALDEEFGHMAADTEYQEEARRIAAEFARADWEAWQRRA